jgi:uncharacterized protein YutE (UPF0331/DUF86 family)
VIDQDIVTRKLLLIMRDLDALRAIAGGDRAAYLANRIEQAASERYVERLIGRMIDINYHLLTESGQAPPSDYFGAFTRLADIGVLDREFASRIAGSAGLRNRIVHEYDEIDPAKVFDALQSAVTDVPHYVERVTAFLTPFGQ